MKIIPSIHQLSLILLTMLMLPNLQPHSPCSTNVYTGFLHTTSNRIFTVQNLYHLHNPTLSIPTHFQYLFSMYIPQGNIPISTYYQPLPPSLPPSLNFVVLTVHILPYLEFLSLLCSGVSSSSDKLVVSGLTGGFAVSTLSR